jgi:asparagine synthetase B (glutamine-hydrolysing)
VNTASGEVWLAGDPLGVKPHFYVTERDRLWFASEPRAVEDLGADVGDVVALAQFLTFLWIPDPRTARSRVRSVLLVMSPTGGNPDPLRQRPTWVASRKATRTSGKKKSLQWVNNVDGSAAT